MRIHTLSALALTALAGTAGVATAQTPTYAPVKTEITISGAGGAAVKTLACEWTDPQADDRPCLRFQGDPQRAFATIEEAGGVRAEQLTTTRRSQQRITYSRRADHTWLIFHRGFHNGEPNTFGFVCTADGQTCVRWDTAGEMSAHRTPKPAASRLRKR